MADVDQRYINHPYTRDLPFSVKELCTNWYTRSSKEVISYLPMMKPRQGAVISGNSGKTELHTSGESEFNSSSSDSDVVEDENQFVNLSKKEQRAVCWNMFIAAGNLFSDGFANSNTSVISLGLSTVYGDEYTNSTAIGNVSSIVFAGTILGMIFGGLWADNWGRKSGLLVSNALLIVFIILCAGAWGAHTTLNPPKEGGLFAAIIAYRFFLGVGIGAEYPLGSAMSADVSQHMQKSQRSKWFCWFTNCAIDWGFVLSSFIAYIVAVICGKNHINTIWRVTVGIGAIFPMIFFVLRLFMKEGDTFKKNRFTKKVPYVLIYRYYWFRILIISISWFIYDISAYGFSSFSSIILANVEGGSPSVIQTLGWNCLFNVFYLPGCMLGGIFTATYGPRLTGGVGVIVQSIIGFAMAGAFETLRKHIAGFTVMFGIFSTLGEFALGNQMGLLATLSFPPECRGSAYFICSVIGKVGAFASGWIFPRLITHAGGYSSTAGLASPYWLSCSLGCFAGFLILVFLHPMDAKSQDEEQMKFRFYLEQNGFDLTTLGDHVVEAEVESLQTENKSFEGKENTKVRTNSTIE
ncbi:putative metabolite transport protein [Hanseniaspora osmophila]|uniref:Putative metabolite transport protein n=1 Tax=Hanseniaspora osmophila TaxID=56408 RepID=A0A1E5R026_9ASCO|nr:putative metabolite transport protein [Hanseniaspora osmophila]